MRLFLPENLRIKNTTFWIERDEPYTSDQISAMESFAHIWTGQTLTIYDYEHSLKDSKKSLFLILSNSGILKCCTLKLYSCLMAFGWDFKTGALTPNKDLEVLLQYLCKLQTVIWRWPMGPKELIRIIQLKAAYPQSDTVFVVELQPCQFIHAIEKIRENVQMLPASNLDIKCDNFSESKIFADHLLAANMRHNALLEPDICQRR
ncbi:hypothetical protein Ddc_14313 [Ditylenchus destructor]|nr:hypothetical protein Ddc_14313 [Ditylenchus destructor]